MPALMLLLMTGLFAIAAEWALWRLFGKSVTAVHFDRPLAPKFFHVSRPSRMKLLAGAHLAFTLLMLVIAFIFLW